MKKRTTTLVSVNAGGTGGANAVSRAPEISANGRVVVFLSGASDLGTRQTLGFPNLDVFVRDLKRGTTTLVSVEKSGGGGGNGTSPSAYGKCLSISANGRYVAFETTSTDLVADTVTGNGDVFLRDLRTEVTILVSERQAGSGGGDDRSTEPSISGNGRVVAFRSGASDLTTTPNPGSDQIYVRDLRRGTTTLASMNAAGTAAAAGSSYIPSISSNGRFLTFSSEGKGLDLLSPPVPGENSGTTHVIVRDLKKSTNSLVSFNTAGTAAANQFSEYSAISGNGRIVVFYSQSDDLVADDTGGQSDVFVRAAR